MSGLRWRVDVVVMPKDGVSDPQGEAVRSGLHMLGHAGAARVRIGRHVELDVDASSADEARSAVSRMAEQLLSNPVIEQFHVGPVVRLEGSVAR